MINFLTEILGEFPLVVANKIDKASTEKIANNFEEFMKRISDGQQSIVKKNVFLTSLKTGKGVSELKSNIHARLVTIGYRRQFKLQT